MVTNVVLAKFTDQGNPQHQGFPKRADAFKQMAKAVGVTVKDIFWTQGRYDIVKRWPPRPSLRFCVSAKWIGSDCQVSNLVRAENKAAPLAAAGSPRVRRLHCLQMSNALHVSFDTAIARTAKGARSPAYPRLVIATTIMASSLAFIDGSVVNVGLPAIGRSFHAEAIGLQWVVNAYLLPLSALLLLGGAAGDRFGRRRLLIAGVLLFGIASLACAGAPSLSLLLLARFVQGASAAIGLVDAFRQGLNEAGYVEGQNVAIEFRWADGQLDQLPALAAELASRKVDVIVTSGSVASGAGGKSGDLYDSNRLPHRRRPCRRRPRRKSQPAGRQCHRREFLTYVAAPKRLGLLRDLIPALNVLGLLINAKDPVAESVITELTAAVRPFGITLHVERAATERELDSAFAALAQRKVGAVIVSTDPFMRIHMAQVVALAARYAIPDMYSGRDYVVAGGLVGYGASIGDAYRQQGIYAGKILKGEKPADLPIMQSTKFEFVINLKTARRSASHCPSGFWLSPTR